MDPWVQQVAGSATATGDQAQVAAGPDMSIQLSTMNFAGWFRFVDGRVDSWAEGWNDDSDLTIVSPSGAEVLVPGPYGLAADDFASLIVGAPEEPMAPIPPFDIETGPSPILSAFSLVNVTVSYELTDRACPSSFGFERVVAGRLVERRATLEPFSELGDVGIVLPYDAYLALRARTADLQDIILHCQLAGGTSHVLLVVALLDSAGFRSLLHARPRTAAALRGWLRHLWGPTWTAALNEGLNGG